MLGAGGLVYRWWDQPTEQGWSHLSPDEAAFIEAVADAVFPPGGVPALAGADASLARYIDRLIGAMEPLQGNLLRLLLNALDAAPVPTSGATFASLGAGERREVLHGWLTADLCELRSAAQSIVVLVGTGYTVHPETADFFGPLYGCRYGA